MELPIRIGLIFKHYKCFVITIIRRKHMARSNENDSYSLTTTHYLAGRLQTFWIYSAYKIEQREHCRQVLCFTRIQGVLKGATRASPRNRLTLLFYMAHGRPFEGHRLSPTHRFQVGSRTLRVYRAYIHLYITFLIIFSFFIQGQVQVLVKFLKCSLSLSLVSLISQSAIGQ